MTDVTVKLSSMDRSTDPVNASDLLFVTKTESSDSESFAVSANDLQAFIFKETAYTTVDLGLAATDNNQTFYVYTDDTKYFVKGYVNKSGVANAVLNEDSTVRTFVTNYYFNNLSQKSKDTIARVYGLSEDLVTYITTDNDVKDYRILFDPVSQFSFWSSNAEGIPTSWSVSNGVLTLITSTSTYTLNQAKTNTFVEIETLSDLRLYEPLFYEQQVILKRAVSKGPILNEVVTYDQADTTTVDDSISTVVTTNSARWKFNLSEGYNPLLLGFTTEKNNLDVCINDTVNIIVNDFVANEGIVSSPGKIKLGSLNDGTSVFTFNVGITSASFVVFNFKSPITFQCAAGINGFVIDNAQFTKLATGWNGTTNSWIALTRSTRQLFIGETLTLNGPIVSGDDYTKNSTVGIFLGNTADGFMACRGQTISNVNVGGFKRGLMFGTYNTYVCAFKDINLDRNVYNISIDTFVETADGANASVSNSGERFIFDNVFIADALEDNIYVAIRAGEYNFINCSVDYPVRDQMHFNIYGLASLFFTNCHLEGATAGKIVNLPTAGYAAPLYRTVRFINCVIDIITAQSNWARGHFYSAADYFTVQIDKSTYVHYSNSVAAIPKSAYPSLAPYDNGNLINVDWQRDIKEVQQYYTPIACYSSSNLRNVGLGLFKGTAGAAYTFRLNNYDTDYMSTTNGPTITYGEVGDDGAQCLKFYSASNFDVWLTCNVPITPGTANDSGRVSFSFRDDGITGGLKAQASCNPVIIPTASSTYNSSDSSVTTTLSNKSLSANLGSPTVCTDWSNSGQGKGNWQGIMLPKVTMNRSNNTTFGNIQYFTLGIRFTGGTGTFSIKLPVFSTDSINIR